MQPGFFREKFDVILIAALFLTSFVCLITNRNPDLVAILTNVNQAFIYALLALVGVRSGMRAALGPITGDNPTINQNDAGGSGEGKENENIIISKS